MKGVDAFYFNICGVSEKKSLILIFVAECAMLERIRFVIVFNQLIFLLKIFADEIVDLEVCSRLLLKGLNCLRRDSE